MTKGHDSVDLNLTETHHRRLVEVACESAVKPKLIQSLRNDFGQDIASLILTSARLQTKAVKKFGPGTWWCTERALQQSTAWQVARVKAMWMQGRQVFDLCSGLGGDAIPLARRGQTTAVDSDPVVTTLLAANAREADVSVEQIIADVKTVKIPDDAAVHLDPDRRVGERRSSAPDLYQPDWQTVKNIVKRSSSGLIKLAPAAEVDMKPSWHRCFISLQGSVREQTMLTGDAVTAANFPPGGCSAIVIRSNGDFDRFVSENPQCGCPVTSDVGDFLIDPDAAIRAAGLTEAFASANRLHAIGGPAGFLTGTLGQQRPAMAVAGRVIWSGTSDDREIRRVLRSLDVNVTVVKTRGVDVDPAVLQKRFKSIGSHPVTLWMGKRSAGKSKRFAALTGNIAPDSMERS